MFRIQASSLNAGTTTEREYLDLVRAGDEAEPTSPGRVESGISVQCGEFPIHFTAGGHHLDLGPVGNIWRPKSPIRIALLQTLPLVGIFPVTPCVDGIGAGLYTWLRPYVSPAFAPCVDGLTNVLRVNPPLIGDGN